MAHLSLREGTISHIELNESGKWKVTREVELGTAAEVAIHHPKYGLLIVAIDALISYDGKTPRKLQSLDLGGLYPNSIALGPSNAVYVGMRYAVARIDLEEAGPRTSWLVPPTCRSLEKAPGSSDCECRE